MCNTELISCGNNYMNMIIIMCRKLKIKSLLFSTILEIIIKDLIIIVHIRQILKRYTYNLFYFHCYAIVEKQLLNCLV